MREKLALLRLFHRIFTEPKQLNDGAMLSWLGVSYCKEPKEYTSAWTATERILVRFKSEIERKNSRLLVFTVPALVEVDVDYMKATESQTNHPERLCLEQASHRTKLNQILTKQGMQLIDLLPDFRHAHRKKGIELYSRSDRHWNAVGHALAAERVFSKLVERKLLPIRASAAAH